MNKATILSNYLEFKKTSIKSKEKLQDIERYLSMFLNSSKKPLDKFSDKEIINFLNSLEYSIGTINNIKYFIISLLKWSYVDWSSKFRNLEKVCKTQTPPKTYTPDQMISFEDFEKIVKQEDNLMWKTYWLVFFYGGFRPSEACSLKWENVFFEPEGVVIKLRTGKTRKDFIKSLPKEAEHTLKELKQNSSSEFLFPSIMRKTSHILSPTVCARLRRISKKALGKSVVPYQLRHSIGTLLYGDDSKKDDDVAQQMGHTKNMRMTYKNLNGEQIKFKARALWGKPLTLGKREELEKQIEAQNKIIKEVEKTLQNQQGQIQSLLHKRQEDIEDFYKNPAYQKKLKKDFNNSLKGKIVISPI